MALYLGRIRAGLLRLTMRWLDRGPHLTRYTMYRRLEEVGQSLPIKEGDVLSVSHSTNLCELMGVRPRTVAEANYPDHDLLALPFADDSFDFVLSDQVLEHVEGDPQQAVDESLRVLRPGGIAVHTTCFINPVHGHPNDFWRFTPNALRLLLRSFSRIIDCDGWGNFEAWLLVRDGLRYDGVPHAKWHPVHRIATRNDPRWPIVTWIVAQK